MQIISFFGENAPWSWIAAGLVLLALELVMPGVFLVWLGVAGILTGMIVLFQPLEWPVQWLVFGVLSISTILIWVRFTRNRAAQTDRPLLNLRGEHYVGQEGVLEAPISGGFGRLRLGDTTWRVSGPDLKAGQRVRITGADGAVLKVEAVPDT